MTEQHPFARQETFPSWFPNAIQEFISVDAINFKLLRSDDHTLKVPAGTGDAQVTIGIGGNWRYNRADVTRAHPGGAAGIYDAHVTAKAQSIVSTPAPFTDATDYTFALAITAHGATPPIVGGTVDETRKVGEVDWDGAKITGLRQFVGQDNTRAIEPTAQVPSETPIRIRGAAAQTADLWQLVKNDGTLLRGVDAAGAMYGVGIATTTLLRNFLTTGDAQPAYRLAGSGRQEWGPGGATVFDTDLYRAAAGVLETDGVFESVGALIAMVGGAQQVQLGALAGAPAVLFGSALDAAIYRSAAGIIRTDGKLSINGLATHGAIGPGGEPGVALGAASDVKIYRSATSQVRIDADVYLNGKVGFGVAPVARPPARVISNAAAALRTLDRSTFTMNNLFDFLATLVADLQTVGLLA